MKVTLSTAMPDKCMHVFTRTMIFLVHDLDCVILAECQLKPFTGSLKHSLGLVENESVFLWNLCLSVSASAANTRIQPVGGEDTVKCNYKY